MFNIANIVTLLRLAVIPLIGSGIMFSRDPENGVKVKVGTFILLTLFTFGDFCDGYLARKLKVESRLGAVLDPLADKLLISMCIIIFSMTSWREDGWLIPKWFIYLTFFRDFSIGLGCLFILGLENPLKITPHWSGKLVTFMQFLTIISLMFSFFAMSPLLLIITSLLTLISAWFYALECLNQLSNHSLS